LQTLVVEVEAKRMPSGYPDDCLLARWLDSHARIGATPTRRERSHCHDATWPGAQLSCAGALGARYLETAHRSVLEVAGDVGYESEAAFNRAFRREFRLPPGGYRRKERPSPARQKPKPKTLAIGRH
jgi:Helix-turn-helix domain